MIPSFNPLPLKEEEETLGKILKNMVEIGFNPLPLKEEEETLRLRSQSGTAETFQSASS
ncbi:hypothetical protein LEP1GSC046_1462 [Leptospira kirschneri serovar Bim str. 1051]|uniref:hypothetical protein n=1 Tax=Leptospira kirschneri TaxID=29507 RepID=UPI0002BF768F|nr:hypothetical protein LEP1GSC042_1164 [Leptospira kirschneri serovar Bim str. PUO 1247]EMN05313.1 hypothetical protein LEP1GSC046_1462 [Leptospira kirschneri serovar Bim str. 1051]